MRIERTAANAPSAPAAPAAAPTPAAPTSGAQSFSNSANAAALALQLEEQRAGGGGGGGGKHAAHKVLSPIDDIAARASLNIEDRKKTMLDRQREIERLKAEMAAADQQVGEKQPGPDDRQTPDKESDPEKQPT